MKKPLNAFFVLLTLILCFDGMSALAVSAIAVPKKHQKEPGAVREVSPPQESLEFLSLGEYWGVRTDIDAAQGGNDERKIIDLQYDWDSAVSASKEEEVFSKLKTDQKPSDNLPTP